MTYGKLINGKLIEAPKILNKDGKQYINPPEELYLEYGYLPLEYTNIPTVVNDYHLVQSWINNGEKLVQRWNYERNGVEDTSALQAKINELENIVNSIKNPFNIEKEEFPKGDYMNPIQILEGGLIVEKDKWYYTDDKMFPLRASMNFFATPDAFINTNTSGFYFN